MLVPSAYGSAYQYVLQGKKTRGRCLLLSPGEDQLQHWSITRQTWGCCEPGGWQCVPSSHCFYWNGVWKGICLCCSLWVWASRSQVTIWGGSFCWGAVDLLLSLCSWKCSLQFQKSARVCPCWEWDMLGLRPFEGSSWGSLWSDHGDLSSYVCSPSWSITSHLCLGAVSDTAQACCCVTAAALVLTGCVSALTQAQQAVCPSWHLCLGQQCTSRPFALVCIDWGIQTGRGAVEVFLGSFSPWVLLLWCPSLFSACFSSSGACNNGAIILWFIKASMYFSFL